MCSPANLGYEFGFKVSIATTLDEEFVIGMRSFAGKPYDSQTLGAARELVESLTERLPDAR